jgi:hypothetical protein
MAQSWQEERRRLAELEPADRARFVEPYSILRKSGGEVVERESAPDSEVPAWRRPIAGARLVDAVEYRPEGPRLWLDGVAHEPKVGETLRAGGLAIARDAAGATTVKQEAKTPDECDWKCCLCCLLAMLGGGTARPTHEC